MKRILPYILISAYFFSFLIKEWNFNILAYDRVYPQILFISIINFISFCYIIYNNQLNVFIKKAFSNSLIISYMLFTGFCIISIIFSLNIAESIISVSFYITFLFSFMIIYFLSLILEKNFISFCIILFVVACFFESIAVIYSAVDLKFIQNVSVERTLDIRGFAANINISAFSIVYKIPFLMYILYKVESKRIKYISIILLFFSFSAIFLLLSRGAFIALIVSVVFFILLNFKRNTFSKSIVIISILLMSGLSVEKIFLSQNTNQIVDRISSISSDRSDDSVNQRLFYYSHALTSIKKNPIFGIGIGNWKIESISYASKIISSYTIPYHVHNDFLQIGAEIGLIGLIFYVFLVSYPILLSIKQLMKKEHNDLYIIVLLVLISYFIDSMLNFPVSRVITHMQLIFIVVLFSHIHKSISYK